MNDKINEPKNLKKKRFSFTNRVPVSSDDDDDEESNSPNELVCCPPPGFRLNESDLLPALKMLRLQCQQIGGLVDPLF